jgi:hypothetical protein
MNTVLWCVTPCGLSEVYLVFGSRHCAFRPPENYDSSFLRSFGKCLRVHGTISRKTCLMLIVDLQNEFPLECYLYQYFLGLVLPSGQKTYFRPTGHRHLRSRPLSRVCAVPSAFAIFFNAFWKSCSLWMFSTASGSVSITSAVLKWWYLQSGKQRKVAGGQVRRIGWVGEDSHSHFGQKFRW